MNGYRDAQAILFQLSYISTEFFTENKPKEGKKYALVSYDS